jgi:hypothetical protein
MRRTKADADVHLESKFKSTLAHATVLGADDSTYLLVCREFCRETCRNGPVRGDTRRFCASDLSRANGTGRHSPTWSEGDF